MIVGRLGNLTMPITGCNRNNAGDRPAVEFQPYGSEGQ